MAVLQAMHLHSEIGTLPESYFASPEFGKAIHTWCMMSGIRDFPDQPSLNLIIELLRFDFRNLTIPEISQMLKLNAIGDLPEEVLPYNALTANFLLKVLKQYRKYRSDIGRKLENAKEAILKRNKPTFSDLQKDLISVFGIMCMYSKFLNSEQITGISTAYDVLKRLKVITFTSADEDAEQKIAVEALRSLMADMKDATMKKELTQVISDENRLNSMSKIKAQEKLCQRYFAECGLGNEQFQNELAIKTIEYHSITIELFNNNVYKMVNYLQWS